MTRKGLLSGLSGRKKWIAAPALTSAVVLLVTTPAFAMGGKLPILSGNSVPVAIGRQVQNMRHDEIVCQRTTVASLRAGAIADYNNIANYMASELSAAGNTEAIPNIGFYCPQSGVTGNITPGEAYVPVQHANQIQNLRNDAVTCVRTTDPRELSDVIYDYNLTAFSPGTLQDQLTAENNPSTVPPIHDLCPRAP